MYELLLFLFLGGALLVLLVGAPVLAIVAFLRTTRRGALSRRLDALEEEVGFLRKKPARDEAESAGQAPPAPAEAPQPAAKTAPPPPAVRPKPAPVQPAAQPSATPATPSAATKTAPGPAPARKAERKRVDIDWERWVGVRGAAAVGGVILALAAILLFKYAFEEGIIGPLARCWMGVGAGVACLIGAVYVRKRDFRFVPNALEGAGLVAFYASIWASHQLYGFLSLAAVLPLMAAVTALACALALRHRSQLTAVLGLVGGFTAAWILSADADRPLGLFGYILLLDLGLLFVGHRRGWPSLGALALLGTFLFESIWVFGSMDEERMFLGLGILAVFAVLFALAGQFAPEGKRRAWIPSQAGAVLFPFVFALYFAGRTDFRGHVYPTAALLAILAAGACFIGRGQRQHWLPVGAGAACISVVAVWLFGTDLTTALVWELTGVSAGLALVFHLFAEWEERGLRAGSETSGLRTAATVVGAGALALVVFSCSSKADVPVWPWLAGLAALAGVLVRQSCFQGRAATNLIAATGLGLGLCLYQMAHLDRAGSALPHPVLLMAIHLAAASAFLAQGLLRPGRGGTSALHGVGLVAFPLVAGCIGAQDYLGPHHLLFLLDTLALGLLIAGAATRLGSRVWYLGALVLTALVHGAWNDAWMRAPRSGDQLMATMAVTLLAAALFTYWPLVFLRTSPGRRMVWVTAALATPAFFLTWHELYIEWFSDGAILVPWAVAGLLVAGAAFLAGRRLRGMDSLGTARLWLWGVALAFLSAALPAQLDFEWLAVSGAVYTVALAFLARRLDSRAAAALAVAAGLATTVLFIANSLDTFHYEREDALLFHWISYAHVASLACLLGAAYVLRTFSGERIGRVRVTEPMAIGLGAIILGFLWINFVILNHFSEPGTSLSFRFERLQARDLAHSIAWAVYALLLLGTGMGMGKSGLRWTSLLLLLITIAKVFLYDLGELDGLHRVGSLAGLALSLLAVSLLYQRFVFRGAPAVSR